MPTSQIDLQPFCGQYARTQSPFVRDGVRYATDGAILIAMPADGEPDSDFKAADAGGVMKASWAESASMQPWPAPNYIDEMQPCKHCEENECSTCEGCGFQTCNLGHEHDCEDCDGRGFFYRDTCHVCHGNRHALAPSLMALGALTIDIKYDELIRALPGPVEWAESQQNGCIQFQFAGGRGLVMEKKRS